MFGGTSHRAINLSRDDSQAVQFKGLYSAGSPSWVKHPLVRLRWWLFILLCLLVGFIELIEFPFAFKSLGSVEYEEVIAFFIVMLTVWSAMEILLRTIVVKSRAVDLLEIKQKLNRELALASDWNSMVDLILGFCQAQIDVESVVLLLRDTRSGGFKAAAWSENEMQVVANNGDGLRTGTFCTRDDLIAELHRFEITPESAGTLTSSGYCLPLILGDRAIAKLNFYLPVGNAPSEWQAEIFNVSASVLAIALASAQLRQESAELLIDQAQSAQRRRIYRDLHDALGQKLVYLRFKLDQYAHSDGETQLAEIRHDLEQMEVAANESYELVRGTLAVLSSETSPSLFELLVGHSRLATDRNQLRFTFDEKGQPQTLPVEALQQVFYIFGEALSNVERHAGAKNVDVALVWNQTELTIEVVDDGRGFDTGAVPKDGHYGLTTMRQRADILGGQIDLQSTPDCGTRLTIHLPIGDN